MTEIRVRVFRAGRDRLSSRHAGEELVEAFSLVMTDPVRRLGEALDAAYRLHPRRH